MEEAREKEDEKNEAAGEEVEEEEVKEEEGWQGSSKCVSARATLSGRDVLQKRQERKEGTNEIKKGRRRGKRKEKI